MKRLRLTGTVAVHHRDERVSVRLSERKNLPGQVEIRLCAGTELLLLPRSGGFLSHWGFTGPAESTGVSGPLCRSGSLFRIRESAGTLCLRLAVSLWAGTGPAASNSPIPKEKAATVSSRPEIREIRGADSPGLLRVHVLVWRLRKSPGLL